MTIEPLYLVQLTLNGLVLGLLYALIAVGLALIFGVLEIINFAHGEFLMLGAYAMVFVLPVVGLLYAPALLAAVLIAAAGGLVLYELFLARLKQNDFERSILITIGLSIMLLHGTQYLASPTPRLVDTEFGFDGVAVGDIRITWTRLIAGGLALAAFGALYLILNHTPFGRAMRAIAQNREAALMVGVKPRRVARNAVVLSTALCGLAGAALAPIQLVQPIMGQALIVKAFALVIIGGLGSLPGAIAASVALGLFESWIGGFFEIIWQEVGVFLLMILVLLVRPNGVFGRAVVRAG